MSATTKECRKKQIPRSARDDRRRADGGGELRWRAWQGRRGLLESNRPPEVAPFVVFIQTRRSRMADETRAVRTVETGEHKDRVLIVWTRTTRGRATSNCCSGGATKCWVWRARKKRWRNSPTFSRI